ncbi:MAG: transglycosylase domain-containing protein [Frankiales bacterium]|nr:transglycosylase domain-containing protein [Frankiales bacterium]
MSVLTGLLLAGLALPVVGGLGLSAKAGADEFLVLPDELKTTALDQRSRILAADGSEIAVLYRENRVETKLQDIPELTRKAVIAIEDSRFYAHDGVDYKGTLRAAIENLQAGGVSQGGSTLTQQYVKNALLQAASTKEGQRAATERSFDRKLKEARYALAIERKLTKDQILEKYLNIAYYGNGVYGLGTAANAYFGKPAQDLTLSQGATLAGIVQSPGRFDPVKALQDRQAMATLMTRRNTVLARMRELGYITESQRAQASADRSQPGRPLFTLKPVVSGCEAPGVDAPYFCDYIRRTLEDDTPLGATLGSTREQRQARLLGGGLTIKTTLSPGVQAVAQRSAEEAVPPADQPFQAAVAVDIVEPGTGFVKAMVVNRRYTESTRPGNTKVNLAIGGSSGFQGGSTFKAFVLADAIRQGIPTNFTLFAPQKYTSKVFDKCSGCGPYEPQNAGDSESGTFDLAQATHDSVNTYYVQLEERLAVNKKVEGPASLAESMGVKQFAGGRPSAPLLREGSFVLGSNDVSPLDMASAYATFAARGLYCPPRPVVEILDSAGQPIELPAQQCKQVLEQPVADTVTQILSGVIDGNTPGRTGRAASIGRPAAGKTGTTDGSRAAWFVGYTPQLATAVWMGDPGGAAPGEPVKMMRNVTINGRYYSQVYGGTLPAPIWASTMRGALEGVPVVPFAEPDRSVALGQQVDVPDVSGLPIAVAEEKLIEAGFSVLDGGRVSAAPIERGSAAYTLPRAGAPRPFGSRVTLFESNGRTRQAAPPAAPTFATSVPTAPQQGPGNGKGNDKPKG